MPHEGFILSTDSRTTGGQTRLELEGRLSDGRRFRWLVEHPRPVFFLPRSNPQVPAGSQRREVQLHDMLGHPVDALYFPSDYARDRARREIESGGARTLEADVSSAARYLMERFVRGSVRFLTEPDETLAATGNTTPLLQFREPKVEPGSFTPNLRLLSIDIECSERSALFSIALFGKDYAEVFMIDPEGIGADSFEGYNAVPDERSLLEKFFAAVAAFDPDALIGWNVVGFDLQILFTRAKEYGIPFGLGASGPGEMITPASGRVFARLPGIAVLDGIDMLRAAFVTLDDYSLETAAKTLLGRGKLIHQTGADKLAEIKRQFREDKITLARYNLEDTRLVFEIFEKLALSDLAVRKAQLTGLPVDRSGGSAAAFDFLYLPRLHRRGFVAPTLTQISREFDPVPGGLVLDSTPGFHRNVLVLDFKSLYPSIMLTFSIDPLAGNIITNNLADRLPEFDIGPVVRGPAGLSFAKQHSVLPEILQELWSERDRAKRVKDGALSQAVKIIMNSFYGVLGSPGCRFFEPELAGTITRIGHWVLTHSRDFATERGLNVIYGDTDSLFVSSGQEDPEQARAVGEKLVVDLNEHLIEAVRASFGVESKFVIEFEKLYTRFFLPTIRGDETGARKRYAGLVLERDGSSYVGYAGMETSRRDWTGLAHKMQIEMFALVFYHFDEPDLPDRLEALTRKFHEQLLAGDFDELLVYRKGLSKPIAEYQGSLPPHVRAAAQLGEPNLRVVRYVMTLEGPEPIQKRSSAALDYRHYADKQLAPIADMILRFYGTNYAEITGPGKQLDLF